MYIASRRYKECFLGIYVQYSFIYMQIHEHQWKFNVSFIFGLLTSFYISAQWKEHSHVTYANPTFQIELDKRKQSIFS